MRGFGARDELALAVACWFCHVVGVCVWGWANVSGVLQSVQVMAFADDRLILLQTEGN